MRSLQRNFLLSIVGFAALVAACSDDFGTACELPDTPAIQSRCSTTEGSDSRPTCVFALSADCNSNICAVYEGSRPFCSKSCQTDSDCPAEARCETSPDDVRYCVPAGLLSR